MNKLLSSIALLPMLGFSIIVIYQLVAKHEIYTNYHWFIVSFIALQSYSLRLKQANNVVITIFVAGILANILLLISSALDLQVTPVTHALFIGFLCLGYFMVMINFGVNWYRKNTILKN